MLLHDAEWFVDDAARRMSIAQKEADRALVAATARIDEVLAFDVAAEVAKAVESARVAADRMRAELAKFTSDNQYVVPFAEIQKAADTPAWASVKDRAKILALDFETVTQKFADQVTAIAAVAAAAKSPEATKTDLEAIELLTAVKASK